MDGSGAVVGALFVILLQGGQILPGVDELGFLHALAQVPMHVRPLGEHQIEFIIDARPHLADGGRIAGRAAGQIHLGDVAARHRGGRLVVDADLEAGRTPFHERQVAALDHLQRGVHLLGQHQAPVQHAAGHVLAAAGVALEHLGAPLEAHPRQVEDGHLLVLRLVQREEGRVRDERVVDARVRHQVRLEFGHVDVDAALEALAHRQRGDHLGQDAVQVDVRRQLDVQILRVDVVKGLVVRQEGAVAVFDRVAGRQHSVVRLYHAGRQLPTSFSIKPAIKLDT